jgi:hypothetical protein
MIEEHGEDIVPFSAPFLMMTRLFRSRFQMLILVIKLSTPHQRIRGRTGHVNFLHVPEPSHVRPCAVHIARLTCCNI